MTRLAVISDIHGNLPALEAVIADLENFEIDDVIVQGDVISIGPCARQAVERVIEKRWSVIRGNNEYFLMDCNTPRAPAEWSDPVQFAPTAWLDRQFDQRLKGLIASWPDTLRPLAHCSAFSCGQRPPGTPLTDALGYEYLSAANWREYAHPAYHINME